MARGGRNALRGKEQAVNPILDNHQKHLEDSNLHSSSIQSTSNQEKNSKSKQNPHKNEPISVDKDLKLNSSEDDLNCETANSSIGEEICGEQENEVPEFNTEEGERNNEAEEAIDAVDSVVIRLEELQLGLEEPELSEEQLKLNDQLQQDELLAVEAIYGENVFMLDNQNGLRSFQIHIHIASPEKISVAAKLDSDENLDTFKVQYLPPFVLTCLLPRSYPSHVPPRFAISVQWLDSFQISELCLMLDSIWKEQAGLEVIYPWADWLQSCSLSYLGFDKEIVLTPDALSHSCDRISLDFAVAVLRSYNDEKCAEDFLKSLHECCICFTEYTGSEFVKLPCQHMFCRKCMMTYSDLLVNEGTIKCPEVKCEGLVPPGLVKELLSGEVFERWQSLMAKKNLDSVPDIVYCPRCETPCVEDGDHHAQCSKCFYSFCTLCLERRHVGTACMSPEMKLRTLQQRSSSSNVKSEQLVKLHDKINQLVSVSEILSDAQQCPRCKIAISRISGCNHMVCKNCGQEFCYQCGSKLVGGYAHFGNARCPVFPPDVIARWQGNNPPPRPQPQQCFARWGGQGRGQWRAQQLARAEHEKPCPNCRQPNYKVGNNNHIHCRACQTQFCYLCLTVIKRTSLHFRPNGCKQHTVE